MFFLLIRDDVKTDTQRENYLGNSVNAAVGRWQKNKDLYWYNKLDKDEIKGNSVMIIKGCDVMIC